MDIYYMVSRNSWDMKMNKMVTALVVSISSACFFILNFEKTKYENKWIVSHAIA